MRIPLGQFGQVMQAPQSRPVVAPGGDDAAGQAFQRLGATVQQASEGLAGRQIAADKERQAKDLAMARAEAAHHQVQYELDVNQAAQDLGEKISTGEVAYGDADQAWEKAMQAIPVPIAKGLPEPLQMAYDDGIDKLQVAGFTAIQKAADGARQSHFKAQFGETLDALGKLAGMPGADIDQINAKAKAFVPLARKAGLSEDRITAALQKFEDTNWTQQAVQRANMGRNSVDQLRALAHDLTDKEGRYAGKLDANKRNAIMLQVTGRIETLRDRAERAQQRANAKGAQAIAQMDRQIASGIPATPEMWAQWAQATRGTDSAADFRQRATDEKQVQKLLRLPPEQQTAYIQQAEAKLQSQGGTLQEAANVNRLKAAVGKNLKQLQTNPLLFNQARMGDAVKPLDLSDLASGNVFSEVRDNLQDRAATIKSMRAQYGDQVPAHLLLPQELDALKDVLQSATAKQKTKLFGTLYQLAGSDAVYGDIMSQLAPQDETLSYAGMLSQRDAAITLETHWFRPDDTVNSQAAAETLMRGVAILAGKGDKPFKAPSDTDFRSAFSGAVGNLFAGRPSAARTAMQAVKSYYVGQAADAGDTSGEVDDTRLKHAILATLGSVVDMGGQDVLAPWGMSETEFTDAARRAYQQAVAQAGFTPEQTRALTNSWSDMSLTQAGDGRYYVNQGRDYLHDAQGNPLTIQVTP